MGSGSFQDHDILGAIMEVLRCIHCGNEGEGFVAHKSTCVTPGHDEDYTKVKSTSVPKQAQPEKSSTKTTKKSKGRK